MATLLGGALCRVAGMQSTELLGLVRLVPALTFSGEVTVEQLAKTSRGCMPRRRR